MTGVQTCALPILLWRCFSSAGIVTFEGQIDGAKYREILQDNLLQSAKKTKAWEKLHLSAETLVPMHNAKATQEWFNNEKVNVLQRPSQSADLKPIENLWHYLKIAVRKRRPTNLNILEQICQEEWENISPKLCAKLVETHPNRLKAVNAAKGGSKES